MKNRSRVILALAAATILLGATAEAQLPNSTWCVAASAGGQAGNSLVAFDRSGVLTSVVPFTRAATPGAIAMGPRNDKFLVWDDTRLHEYDLKTGVQQLTTIVGKGTTYGVVDEDGGLAWVTNRGLLLKSTDVGCTKLMTMVSLPNYQFNSVAWNGTTGGWVIGAYDTTRTDWHLLYVDSYGIPTGTLKGFPPLTGIDWSPWNGGIYATCAGQSGGLFYVDSKGAVSTLNLPAGPARADLNSVEVREQPLLELVCTEAGADPQHVISVAPTGGLSVLHSSSGQFSPADVEILRHRQLWSTVPWGVGKTGMLSVDFGPSQAGKFYVVALSFGHMPGIPLPGLGMIHLRTDLLFQLSLTVGAPMFTDFQGVLDGDGKAPVPPSAQIPADFNLSGVRIYGGAIAFDKSGITAVSNCWGITMRWT